MISCKTTASLSISGYPRPRKLLATDEVDGFDCGQTELNNWLTDFALLSQRSGMSTVFVSAPDGRVAGYYAIAAAGVSPASAPERVTKGVPRHPVPMILLARLAVDVRAQGSGLGRALVADAMRRVAAVADQVGVRALLVHAKDQAAREFYLSLASFEQSPTDELHLFLLLKDLRRAIAA